MARAFACFRLALQLQPRRFVGRLGTHWGISSWAIGVAAFVGWATITGRLFAEPTVYCGFDGPHTTWRLAENEPLARVLSQECLAGGARDSLGVERVVLSAPAGQSVRLGCSITPVVVLPELQIRLWVKSPRPSIQLAARIRLPRSKDPETGLPMTAVVRGALYDKPGHWQQLSLSDIPKLLASQVRIMRAKPGANIDSHEAVVEAVVLIIPADPQGVEVLTDALEVDGVLAGDRKIIERASHTSTVETPPASIPAAGPACLRGGLLLVHDKPFLPRIIEWQGEPLGFLADRGFNAVQLPGLPTDEQIAEAEKLGLWFVATAPLPDRLSNQGLARRGDRIIAWLIRDQAIETDPMFAARWSELIRKHDAGADRPVLVDPKLDWTAAARSADIVAAPYPRPSGYTVAAYVEWIEQCRRRARPGTPLWAVFPTQFGPAATQQVNALSERHQPPPTVDVQVLESLVDGARLDEVRGFFFQSSSSLNETDAVTRTRALALELINRRLQHVEPWLAGGNVVGRIQGADADWNGVIYHVDHARLLVPVRVADVATSGAAQPLPPAPAEVSFVVPGIPESSQVYAFSPVELRILPAQRVAGGTRVTLPASRDTFVLITEDPRVVQGLRQRVARDGPPFVKLQRELLVQRMALTAKTTRELAQAGYQNQPFVNAASAFNASIQQIDARIAAQRLDQACQIANLAHMEWAEAVFDARALIGLPSALESNPLSLSCDQIADLAKFNQTHQKLRGGDNLLYGGDFEDLGQMLQFGWQHIQHPLPGVESHVELSAVASKNGQHCLAMHVSSTDARGESSAAPQPVEWIVSPAIFADEGRFLKITGWVQIDRPFLGDNDGLHIMDSIGGKELALVIRETNGWQPFAIFRRAAKSDEFRLSFAISGSGSARIDAVMVVALAQPTARRLPQLPAQATVEADRATLNGPLFAPPETR